MPPKKCKVKMVSPPLSPQEAAQEDSCFRQSSKAAGSFHRFGKLLIRSSQHLAYKGGCSDSVTVLAVSKSSRPIALTFRACLEGRGHATT